MNYTDWFCVVSVQFLCSLRGLGTQLHSSGRLASLLSRNSSFSARKAARSSWSCFLSSIILLSSSIISFSLFFHQPPTCRSQAFAAAETAQDSLLPGLFFPGLGLTISWLPWISPFPGRRVSVRLARPVLWLKPGPSFRPIAGSCLGPSFKSFIFLLLSLRWPKLFVRILFLRPSFKPIFPEPPPQRVVTAAVTLPIPPFHF